MGRAPALFVVLSLACSLGCPGNPGAREVELSWRFVDGRPCDLAGVAEVQLVAGGTLIERWSCLDGIGGDRRVQASLEGGDDEARVLEGRSITGALLYRGELPSLEGGDRREITLRFVGGESPTRR